jgi:hypothetical protein
MSVGEIGAMTLVKVKEFSMSTIIRLTKIMNAISKLKFIDRNRKGFVISLAVWLTVNVAGYFIYNFAARSANDTLYQQGLSATSGLATKSGPFVLEKDVLALNVAIKELQDIKDLKFAAITDHKNTILTHTDTEMINRKFEPLRNEKPIDWIDGIRITSGMSPDKTKVVGFFRNITFSGIDIGKVYIALSAANLSGTLNRLRSTYVSGVLVSIVLLVVVLYWLDRTARVKTVKVSQDMESMKQIGPYHLRRKVARGGMAELFLADYVREDGFRRKVAVKPHILQGIGILSRCSPGKPGWLHCYSIRISSRSSITGKLKTLILFQWNISMGRIWEKSSQRLNKACLSTILFSLCQRSVKAWITRIRSGMRTLENLIILSIETLVRRTCSFPIRVK